MGYSGIWGYGILEFILGYELVRLILGYGIFWTVYFEIWDIAYRPNQASFPKCVLPVRQEFMFIKMDHIIFEHTLSSRSLQGMHIKETGRKFWARDLSLFLNRRQISARYHSLGISHVSIDCWKRWAITGPSSIASSFRTLG